MRFVFGEFELHASLFELRKRGRRVPVQPKVLKLLIHLVENRARVVPQEELLRVLWPGETVCSNSVRRAVNGARRALGEGKHQQSIQTVVGYGYRFVQPIDELPSEARNAAAERAGPPAGLVERIRPKPCPALALPAFDDLFIGRDATLEVLELSLTRALAGSGGVLLLCGEPGVGKTRTALELARRAQELGVEVCLGRCRDVDGAPAFWPWLQIMRQCIGLRGEAEVQKLLGTGAAEMVEILPELGAAFRGPSAPPIDDAYARFRLFDSIAQFLIRASAERALTLIVDDLQIADEPSLRLLVFLSTQLTSARLLLVGTLRSTHGLDAPASHLLGELARTGGASCITLLGMQKAELARYLEVAGGERPPPEVVDAVHEQTNGNPLFLRQLTHAWRALGDRDWHWFGGPTHDRSLQESIDTWLAQLSEPCRALLRSAAVIGRQFSLPTLAHASALTIEDALQVLSEALCAGLLRNVDDVLGCYRFVHALVCDALYGELAQRERAHRHERVGRALEAQQVVPDADNVAALAYHFVRAAPVYDAGRAVSYARQAAQVALGRLAYEEAAAHFEKALQVLELGAPDPRQRMELLLGQGEALASAGQSVVARRSLDQAAVIARALGDSDALARAALAMSKQLELTCVDHERVRLLEEVLGALSGEDPRRPLLRALHAKSLLYSGDPERRSVIAREAVSDARRFGDPNVLADTLHFCLQALSEPEQHAERCELTEELLAIARLQNGHQRLLHACLAQVQNHMERGQLRAVDSVLSTMESLAAHARQPYFRWVASVFRAGRAIADGALSTAEELAGQALALGRRFCEPTAYNHYCVQVTGIWCLQGAFDKAEAMARQISASYPALAGWRAVLAFIEAHLGKKELARREFLRLLDANLSAPRRDPFVLSALAPLGALGGMVGDPASARLLYDALLPWSKFHGVVMLGVFTHGPLERHLGLLAMKMHRFDSAGLHFERAIKQAEDMPSVPYVCLSSQPYALMLAKRGRTGDQERAARLLSRALSLSSARGMRGIAEACRAAADRHGLVLREPSQSSCPAISSAGSRRAGSAPVPH